jgi:hypothetical protein
MFPFILTREMYNERIKQKNNLKEKLSNFIVI